MRKKCYTDWHMRNLTTMLCVFVVAACAVGASLPVPDFADAGASTNIVFAASSMPGAVTFALEFAPTPTNNVEIALGVDVDGRTNVATARGSYATSQPGIYAAGDMHRGQSLVVWAIAEGRAVAKEVDRDLMGYTNL